MFACLLQTPLVGTQLFGKQIAKHTRYKTGRFFPLGSTLFYVCSESRSVHIDAPLHMIRYVSLFQELDVSSSDER